jgi:hypothetical protein
MAGKVYGLTKDGARYLAEQRASESKSPDTIKLRQAIASLEALKKACSKRT